MNVQPRNIMPTLPRRRSRAGSISTARTASLKALLGALPAAGGAGATCEPYLERLGGLVGGRLDDLAREADKTPPRLEPRDRQGEDRQTHRQGAGLPGDGADRVRRAGAGGRCRTGRRSAGPKPLSAASKYALTYLFVQAEFGLLCPVSMTDSLTRTIRRFAAPELLAALSAGAARRGPRRASCRAPCS